MAWHRTKNLVLEISKKVSIKLKACLILKINNLQLLRTLNAMGLLMQILAMAHPLNSLAQVQWTFRISNFLGILNF